MTAVSSTLSTFAMLLRRHRLASGLTQDALAERAGLSARGVQDLERGVRVAARAGLDEATISAAREAGRGVPTEHAFAAALAAVDELS